MSLVEMEEPMSPRLMVPAVVVALIFFGVFTVRNFTRDPYAAIQAEEQRAAERTAERMRAKYGPSDAYLLTFFSADAVTAQFDPESGFHRSIPDNLGDAILAEMLKRVEPSGINRSYNSYSEQGERGTITVQCVIHYRSYSGRGAGAGYSGKIPERIDATVTMQTARGTGAFEGTHEITASVPVPRSMSPYSVRRVQQKKSRELAKALVAQLD
jgi:hypothetical protein